MSQENERGYSSERIPFPLEINPRIAEQMFSEGKARVERDPLQIVCYYKEDLGPNAEFTIHFLYSGPHDAFKFQINVGGKEVASFEAVVQEDCIDIPHRLVESQSYGISGSDFLKKMEAYFRFLKQKAAIDPTKPLRIEAGQKQVIHWALKNGFDFYSKEQAQLFKDIIADKVEDIISDIPSPSAGKQWQGYIMHKSKYAEYIKDQKTRKERGNTSLKGIEPKHYSLRFDLRKPFPE